jgi:hypothetical protein
MHCGFLEESIKSDMNLFVCTTTNGVKRKLFDEFPYAKRRRVEDDGSNAGHCKFPLPPWSESACELYRPSDRRLWAK